MAKGGQYEREFCKELSLWWTDGERDDVYWRTSNSGGRATTRRKTGKTTYGQGGDVSATDPIGQVLIDLITFELKRGYNNTSAFNILDRPMDQIKRKLSPKTLKLMFEGFLMQAAKSAEQAGSYSWIVVVRRDHKRAFFFMPLKLCRALIGMEAFAEMNPSILIRTKIKPHSPGDRKIVRIALAGMTKEDFFEVVTPRRVKRFARKQKE